MGITYYNFFYKNIVIDCSVTVSKYVCTIPLLGNKTNRLGV